MIEETVQDDAREKQVIELLRLTKHGNRMDPYDAICENGILYEIKTGTKKDIAFSRKVTYETVHRKYDLDMHWIFTHGRLIKDQGYIISKVYLVTPLGMKPHFDTIRNGLDDGLAFFDSYIDQAKVDMMSDKQRERFMRQRRDAAALTNPMLPWTYIEKHGYRLEAPYDDALRAVQDQLAQGGSITYSPVIDLFALDTQNELDSRTRDY